jgi:hypothetical protein
MNWSVFVWWWKKAIRFHKWITLEDMAMDRAFSGVDNDDDDVELFLLDEDSNHIRPIVESKWKHVQRMTETTYGAVGSKCFYHFYWYAATVDDFLRIVTMTNGMRELWIISSVCRNEKKKGEAEKAEILKRVKESDFSINSFANTEFAEMVHQVRCEFQNLPTMLTLSRNTSQNIKSNNHKSKRK